MSDSFLSQEFNLLKYNSMSMGEDSPIYLPESVLKPITVEQVLVSGNRGPCGGVNMALSAAEQVLDIVDGREPVYTNWNIVNNIPAMQDLESRGLVNVKFNWSKIPDGSILFKSAHGVSPKVDKIAKRKNLLVINVTCQLVNRVHTLAKKAEARGAHIVYIGTKRHPEPLGVLGELDQENRTFIQPDSNIESLTLPDDREIVVYSQTTLATDQISDKYRELQARFPNIVIPDRWDICPAVDVRQQGTEDLLDNHLVDFLLVGGSPPSDNSKALLGKATKRGIPGALIDTFHDIDRSWFTSGVKVVGATSGASEREEDFQQILDWFRREGIDPIVYLPQVVPEKNTTFKLPLEDIHKLKLRYP